MSDTTQLIVVEQLPVIVTRLKEIERSIKEKTDAAQNLAVTPESKQAAKKLKADLNKEFSMLETLRKDVKRKVLEPYNEFENIFKQIVTVNYSRATEILTAKINEIEGAEIAEKQQAALDYFNEYKAAIDIPFIFENWKFSELGIKINLSTSLAAIKKQIKAEIDRIAQEYKALYVMTNRDEVLAEYAQCKDMARAISICEARARKQAEVNLQRMKDIGKPRNEEPQEPAPDILETPEMVRNEEPQEQQEPGPQEDYNYEYELTFTVVATKEKLIELKKFLDEGEYKYE